MELCYGLGLRHAQLCAPFVGELFIMSELLTKADLAQALETQTLRLTVRLGAMLAAWVAIAGVILSLS
jgi:hypothetical protein